MAELEPWLRGPVVGVSPLVAPVVRALEQVREDLDWWTSGLTEGQVWERPVGLAPLGFQLRHIAGATNRLLTYARGGELSDAQMAALKQEQEPGAGLGELLAGVAESFRQVEEFARGLDAALLGEPRTVGRKRLPTTVIGLLFHLAEHAQRHLGQAVVTVRVLRGAERDSANG